MPNLELIRNQELRGCPTCGRSSSPSDSTIFKFAYSLKSTPNHCTCTSLVICRSTWDSEPFASPDVHVPSWLSRAELCLHIPALGPITSTLFMVYLVPRFSNFCATVGDSIVQMGPQHSPKCHLGSLSVMCCALWRKHMH